MTVGSLWREAADAAKALAIAAEAAESTPRQESGQLLTVDDLSKFLQVPKSWVYDNYRALRIPHIKIGNKLRFRRAEVDYWLNTHQGGAFCEPHSEGAIRRLQGSVDRPRHRA